MKRYIDIPILIWKLGRPSSIVPTKYRDVGFIFKNFSTQLQYLHRRQHIVIRGEVLDKIITHSRNNYTQKVIQTSIKFILISSITLH